MSTRQSDRYPKGTREYRPDGGWLGLPAVRALLRRLGGPARLVDDVPAIARAAAGRYARALYGQGEEASLVTSVRDRFRLSARHAERGPRGRLFRKYLVVMVGLVGSAVLVTSVVALYFTYRDAEAAASRTLEQRASQLARGLASEARLATQEMAEAVPAPLPPGIQPTLTARRDSYLLRLGRFKQYTYVDGAAHERLRVDSGGNSVIGSGRDLSGDPTVRLALEAAGSGLIGVFGPVTFPDRDPGGPPSPVLAIAVGEGSVRTDGATVGTLDANFLIGDEFYDSGEDVVLYLLDSRGRLLAQPAGTGLTGFPDLSDLPQVAAAISGAAPGVAVWGSEPLPLPAVRRASWQDNSRGQEVLSASAPVAGLGWQVIAEQHRGDVLAPVYSAAIRMVVFLVVFLALAVVASALLARRMVRPITRIDSGARRIGEGALDERIEVETGDELESLSETFNLMAARLGELYADLERRVQDRTRDLSAALEQNAVLLRRLEDRGRDLEAASRHKSEFLAAMSHELRTPLNAILGFSEVLRDRMFGDLNERQAEYLEDIHVSGRHLLALIDDVLDLAKVEAGRMELDLSEVDVGDCLETGLMMVRERALQSGVRLEAAVDPALVQVRADGRRLRQVVFNLLSNAVRFTPEGGVVSASARRGDGEVRIAVSDTGPGIAPEDQERIFETFRQAANADTEGSGLGLALSRALVELHGGRLWLESRVGEGSTFVLALPLVPAMAGR